MPKEIYNEGRVVGYSAWELYVKHALSEDPESEPASEREWLAAQLGSGASLILKLDAEADLGDNELPHIINIPLPEGSTLCAASTIVGSQFFGECEVDDHGWALKVIDYGQGISNTANLFPETSDDASVYPHQSVTKFSDSQKRAIAQYIKIQDGVVLQPGIWDDSPNQPPQKDLVPYLNKPSVVRLTLTGRITHPVYILLTGFMNRNIVSGISGISSGSTLGRTVDWTNPENGDFLGPEIYPWANKIVFTLNSVSAQYLRSGITSSYNNLKIEQDEDSLETTFTASYLRPDPGISIIGPTEPGGDIHIGSKLDITTNQGNANYYVDITQSANSDTYDTTTGIKLSQLHSTPNSGITLVNPDSEHRARDIQVSAPIESAIPDVNSVNLLSVKTSGNIDSSKTTLTAHLATNQYLNATSVNGKTTLNLDASAVANSTEVETRIKELAPTYELQAGPGIAIGKSDIHEIPPKITYKISSSAITTSPTVLNLGSDYTMTWFNGFYPGDDGNGYDNEAQFKARDNNVRSLRVESWNSSNSNELNLDTTSEVYVVISSGQFGISKNTVSENTQRLYYWKSIGPENENEEYPEGAGYTPFKLAKGDTQDDSFMKSRILWLQFSSNGVYKDLNLNNSDIWQCTIQLSGNNVWNLAKGDKSDLLATLKPYGGSFTPVYNVISKEGGWVIYIDSMADGYNQDPLGYWVLTEDSAGQYHQGIYAYSFLNIDITLRFIKK